MKESTVEVARISFVSGRENIMTLNMSSDEFEIRLARWNNGEFIQDAFNNLNNDEREFVKSGITPDEWDYLFGGEEE